MRKDSLDKFLAAKELEMEALALLLPPGVGGHLQVIARELGAMFREALKEPQQPEAAKKAVRKVTID